MLAEVENFKFVDQLQAADKINPQYDCVEASIAACLETITGKTYVPDVLNVWAYGAGHTGGAAAYSFIPYCASQGAILYAVTGTSASACIARARAFLQQGKPVIFTQQDDYSSNPNYTHVCVWYKADDTTLTAMDPWGAKSIMYDDQTWAQRLRQNQLWIMEKIFMLPKNWTDDGNALKCGEFAFVHGFRRYVSAALQRGDDPNRYIPLMNEKAVKQVELHTDRGPGSIQVVHDGMLTYTEKDGVIPSAVGPELMKYMQLADSEEKRGV